MRKSLKIDLVPNDAEIDRGEQTISRFLKSNGITDRDIRIQNMVLRELVNSGRILGINTPSECEMVVSTIITDAEITTEVSHPIKTKSDRRLKELDKTIQFIRGFQDPFEPYLIKRNEVAANPIKAGNMILGLTRIAYEANAIIDFYVSEDNILNLSAASAK